MTEKDFIPITETPYITKLAKDYLLGKDIGINNPLVQNYEGIAEIAETREFSYDKRTYLVNALLAQYKKDGISLDTNSAVYQNIQSLSESNIFTFTTGQQIHIFLGPLFFIYKIQSLLRHIGNFNAKNNAYKAVPVFWMASEDHDLEEINYVKLYGETYKWEASPGNAVGRINCKGLPELIDKIEARADKTEENKELFSLFRNHYSNSKTLAEATRSLLHEIFEKDGLIIIDPDDKILKQSFSATAKREIEDKILFTTYNGQNAVIKKHGYEPRVNAQEINYFWLEGDRRIKLRVKEGEIVKDNSDEKLSLNTIVQNIEKLSPNVITRPLYQETVLPNILYLGGSAEIEYWLPLQAAFKKLGLQFPALIQRDSVLIISNKNSEIIEKEGLEWKELFNDEKELASVFFKNSNFKTDLVSNKVESIKSQLSELKRELEDQKFKNVTVFKEINDLQKNISKVAGAISDELFKNEKENTGFNRILKIKSKLFDLKQERNEFFIDFSTVIKHRQINYPGLNSLFYFLTN